jgi:diketogulonate reductase-like aldo/keto reductase
MQYLTMKDGYKIPMLGYGVYTVTDHEECKQCVSGALEAGYRHIDTAQVYKNEEAVGDALAESGVARGDIFLTTKLWTTSFGYEKAKKAIDVALGKLKTDYVDLMLLHRPFGDYVGAWKAVLEGVKEGKIRTAGVSNFNVKQMERLAAETGELPAVNQIECHPYGQQKVLKAYHDENGIVTEAWYPLGHGDKNLLHEPVLLSIGAKHGKTAAQVILRWHLQEGNVVFPLARSDKHRRENFDVFDFALDEEDMNAIRAMDRDRSYDFVPVWFQKFMSRFQC